MNKRGEITEELKSVLAGRGARFIDSILPPILFLALNTLLGTTGALIGATGLALLFAIIRVVKKESLVYALGGLGGTLLAAAFARLLGSDAGFFVPGLITGALTVILCVVTVAFNRPLVALTSSLARRWPREWYWHPQVIPAYNEVTIAWGVSFAVKLALQVFFFQQGATGALGAVQIFMGWPFTILLLIGSYLYGLRRLSQLDGPSVEEFKSGAEPPYEGQKRGF